PGRAALGAGGVQRRRRRPVPARRRGPGGAGRDRHPGTGRARAGARGLGRRRRRRAPGPPAAVAADADPLRGGPGQPPVRARPAPRGRPGLAADAVAGRLRPVGGWPGGGMIPVVGFEVPLWRAVAAFRIAAAVYVVVLHSGGFEDYARPGLRWVALAVVVGWTALVT